MAHLLFFQMGWVDEPKRIDAAIVTVYVEVGGVRGRGPIARSAKVQQQRLLLFGPVRWIVNYVDRIPKNFLDTIHFLLGGKVEVVDDHLL